MSKFSDNLKELRHSLNMNQKEFAALIGIAQPSLSGYETGNVSPTLDVLQEIAVKCHVSLDWLCGISSTQNNLNSFLDIVSFFYQLEEIDEIKYEIDIHDKLFNDIETETDRWTASLIFYGNEKGFPLNSTMCEFLTSLRDNRESLESYSISKDTYDIIKEKDLEHYSQYNSPLTHKKYEKLDRHSIRAKRIEWLEKHIKGNT